MDAGHRHVAPRHYSGGGGLATAGSGDVIEIMYGLLTVAAPIAVMIGLGVLVQTWGRRDG